MPGRCPVHDCLVSVAVGGAASAFAVWTTVEIALHWHQPNYAMPGMVVVIAALCTVFTLAEAWLVGRRSGDSARSWLTVLTALLFLWGVLTIFSVGLGLLIVAVGFLVVRLRLPRVLSCVGRRAGVSAGLMLSLGLVPLSALAVSDPVVECTGQGVQSSVPMWIWFSSASGSSRSGSGSFSSAGNSLSAHGQESPSGTQKRSGRVSVGGSTYSYSCTDGRLTKFTIGG